MFQVLVVATEANSRKAHTELVRRAGFTAEAIEAVQPAIDYLMAGAGRVDAVLCVGDLGEMDGMDIAAALLRSGRRMPAILVLGDEPDMPIVIMRPPASGSDALSLHKDLVARRKLNCLAALFQPGQDGTMISNAA